MKLKYKLSYIEPSALPGDNAHSLQIENNLKYFDQNFDLTVYSHSTNIRSFPYNKISIEKYFKKKFLPFNIFPFLYKLNKYTFESEYIYTRNFLVALFYTLRCKQMVLEVHDIPEIKDNILEFILFKLPLVRLPFFFLKFFKNIKYVTISNGLKVELVKKGVQENKIIVLPDGVNLEDYKLNENKTTLKKKLNLPDDKKIVMYTGSFQNWKGYDILLNASLNFSNQVQLVMVGGSKKQIDLLKLKYPEVIFVGFVSNNSIPKYLGCADLLVIPNSGKFKISSHYTSPLKLFEYMASGVPIVASNLPSINEICSSGDVLYFKPDNSNDLLLKINTLLKDKELSTCMSKNSYNTVLNYSWEKRVLKIKEFYEK